MPSTSGGKRPAIVPPLRAPLERGTEGEVVPAIGVLVVLAAFGMRLWRLAAPSFWWDEAYSALVASQRLPDIVATLNREDFHPPFHYFLLHYWMREAGSSEFALRFVSVWFGALAVAAAWAAARRLIGPRAAPLAAALFALSPFLWYYSQEARMFAPVPALGTLALYLCARGAAEGRWRFWLGYTLVVALGLWDFYYAVFTPIVCGAWLLLAPKRRRALPHWLAASGLAAALYLPWVPIFLHRTANWSSAFGPDNGPPKVVLWSWPQFLLGLPNLALYGQLVPTALLAIGAVAAVASIAFVIRERSARPEALLVGLAFVVPFALIAAISAFKPIFHPRYAIPVAPGLYLLLAAGLDRAGLASRALVVRGAAAIVGLSLLAGCAYGFWHLRYDGVYQRDDYRDALGYVQLHEQPGDVLAHNVVPPVWYYYHGPAPAAYVPTGAYTVDGVARDLDDLTRGHPRLWYLFNLTVPSDPDGYVDAQLRLHARLLEERHYGAIHLQLWQIPGDDAFRATPFRPAALNLANQLELTGYAVAPVGSATIVGGESLDVELSWKTLARPSSDDGFWVALEDDAGRTWARADTRPRNAAYQLTSDWQPGESDVVRLDLPVPLGTPPGRYALVVGGYRLSDLRGLDVLDPSGHAIGQSARAATIELTGISTASNDPKLPVQAGIALTSGITLVGDDATPRPLAPGDPLPITLLWKGSAPGPASAALELRSASGQVLARADGPVGGAYPADRWPAGALVREQRLLTLPAGAPAGPATLVLIGPDGTATALQRYTIASVSRAFTAPTPVHPLGASLGGTIALDGYGLSAEAVRAGGRLAVTLTWRSLRATPVSYHVFVHLLDARDQVVAQWDGVPKNWTYPTSAWEPGEYVVDTYPLTLPAGTPAGKLALEVGLYDATTGDRLPVSMPGHPSDSRAILGTVEVLP